MGKHGLGRLNLSSGDKSNSDGAIKHKAAADLVTEVDLAVEKLLTEKILEAFPGHFILGEEGTATSGGVTELGLEPTWIIDPIDGTTNFVHGNPFCCVSIGFYLERKGILGIVYNPILDEMHAAELGKGAWFTSPKTGGSPKKMDRRADNKLTLGDSLVGTGFLVGELGKLRHPEKLSPGKQKWLENLKRLIFENHQKVLPQCRDIRRSGSAACDLVSVARGYLDCYWEFGVREWDVAGGIIILQEAGCCVTSLDGKTLPNDTLADRMIMASCNPDLSRELGSLLSFDGFLPFVEV